MSDQSLSTAAAATNPEESQFRFLAALIPQLVWITDPAGFHTYFNQRWIDYTGYTVEASQGTEMWNNLLHPDDQQRARQRWSHSLTTGEFYEIEYRFKGKDGAYRWFLGQALPQRDEAGQIVQWFGTCTDIHEHKLAGETLRWSEQRYQLASLATADAIWDWDLTTNRVTWNDAIYRVLGYTPDTVANTSQWWYDQLHPADAERVVHGIHAAIDGGQTSWQDEYRFRRADGSYAQVLDRGHIAHDAQQKPVRMIGAMQDVTEQRRAEQEAWQREQDFTTLANTIPQLAWMADQQGHVVWYNQRWYEFTGTTREVMQAQAWMHIIHPDYLAPINERWLQCVQTGETWEDTFPMRNAQGDYRWFLSRALPVRDEQGQILRWCGTNTDITEQKQLQDQLERAYSDLEAKITFRTLDLEHQLRELRQRLGE